MNTAVLEEKVRCVEAILKEYLPKEAGFQKTVTEAINYSFLSGGKRLRPLLMQETYRMLGGKEKVIEPFMAALEMIHTYSLIHDDLPCMDNDEYRRGRKTTHVVYGEGMAVLAGDGLLNLAYETAAKAFALLEPDDLTGYKRVARALTILGEKAGIYGMVGGQAVDVESEQKETNLSSETSVPVETAISAEMLLFIHKNKTAALIEAALMIGAVLAGAEEKTIAGMEQCAENIGIAFQIQDDILDITGTMEELGKPIGSDEKNHKQTYVSIWGMEKAKDDVELLSARAVEQIEACEYHNSGDFLKELIRSLIHRTH